MSETVEIMKCSNPNEKLPICMACQRNGRAEEYESFNLEKTLMNGWQCDGYVSKREIKGLFDE